MNQQEEKPKWTWRGNWMKYGVPAFILLLLVAVLMYIIINNDDRSPMNVYNALAFAMIIVWTVVFLAYFLWANQFYNYQYGASRGLWKKIEAEKEKKKEGKPYDESTLDDEPLYNPYKDQTFGMPAGTVRGIIALSLLFGAIALLIASLGMDEQLKPGSFLRDQFEFFKTAFLMMVAFYFGTKGLKVLQKSEDNMPASNTINGLKKMNTAGVDINPNGNSSNGNVTPVNPVNPVSPERLVKDPDAITDLPSLEDEPLPKPPHDLLPEEPQVLTIDPEQATPKAPADGDIPPITPIDPMAKPAKS